MVTLTAQLVGVCAFVIVTVVLSVLVRRRPQGHFAEAASRVSHLAFWLGLVAPWTVGLFWPGPAALDRLVGVSGLPFPLWTRLALGGPALVIGVVLMQASVFGLGREGKGAAAFKLTRSVVATGAYGIVRNPMSLGYYLALLGGAFLSGSTYVLAYTALGLIPAHAFNLKVFEEVELSLRYGEDYESYKRATPFLIPRLRVRPGQQV